MPRKLIKSNGVNIERAHSYEEIDHETDSKISEIDDSIRYLGGKFENEKAAIERDMQDLEEANVSDDDKILIREALQKQLDETRRQYDDQITKLIEIRQREVESLLNEMQDSADEFGETAENLRSETLEATGDDLGEAADAADEKKEQFQQMKEDYAQQLQIRVQQAEQQRRNMMSNTLSGRR